MINTYDTLKIEYNKCPPDCRLCEEACAKEKGEGVIGLSRIKAAHVPQMEFHGAITCVQCSQPRCLQVCPAGAIEKESGNGVVLIEESRCVGCGLCTVACPYGAIYYDSRTQKSFKCDQCGGSPQCVAACPYGLISYISNRPILSYLQEEDLVTPGTSACKGCPGELALRFTLRVLGKNTVLFTAPGCAITWVIGLDTQAQLLVPQVGCLLNNVASTMTGLYRYYKSIGKDAKLVSFVGDGATVDIGFQALSGAAERGENLIYICNDNEGYMNTGVQRSASSPLGARTTTTPVGDARHGKKENSKYLPLIMLFHGIPYVATATMAYPEDYAKKLTKAMKVKDGLSYIHLFSPCTTGWDVPDEQGLEVAQLAVETNYFPLWEAEGGNLCLTEEIENPRPIQEYTSRMGKYSHLTDKDLEGVQGMVNARYDTIKSLSSTDVVYRV